MRKTGYIWTGKKYQREEPGTIKRHPNSHRISREDFISTLNIILDHIGISNKSNIIAYACLKTNYGKRIYANNLFLNKWHEGCGFPFKEVFVNGTQQKIKIKKYDSWETCLRDTPDIEDSPAIGGIVRLYNLGQYNL